ncbi:MAG TPA: ATP-binding protein, partial [Gemmatimonadaceae bacterium]|nr:ATP-binding protein [Gemmatimonadaceae bacterium]
GLDALIAPQVAAKSLQYECAPVDPSLVFKADEEKAQQILLNLLSNAIKFTPAGGSIRVSATGTGDDVHILVADTGPGIPADKHEKIFEPFVQLSRRAGLVGYEGTGLGLAISRDLARAMHGDLTVRSDAGQGATFDLRLPRA